VDALTAHDDLEGIIVDDVDRLAASHREQRSSPGIDEARVFRRPLANYVVLGATITSRSKCFPYWTLSSPSG
jgi:hypothetical protein